MNKGEWQLPSTPEQLDRAGERFHVATVALRDVYAWLERKGEEPPECIRERSKAIGKSPSEYYAYWKSFGFLDPRQNEESQAIEDWAIHQVQPEWKRNPNPKYPKNW